MREILTLQLGNLSNYTATHFWNAQESYFTYGDQEKSQVDHNVHWRAGVGADGSETFLPRTVIYDLKGGFGSLRKTNVLYDAAVDGNAQDSSLWSGPSTIHKQDPITPSAYQESLDAGSKPSQLTSSQVRYWSDFSRVYYHPKSMVQLYDYELNSSIRPFERFAMGTELFSTLDKDHDIVDRDWRPFAEECDLMQGIQVFTTTDDAWGGFASSYLEALRDEYPKTCIWVWGLQSPIVGVSREKRQIRLSNTAQSIYQAYSQASMFIPLAVPEAHSSSNIELDLNSPWNVSGLMAAACESATMPSRLTAGSRSDNVASLSSLAEILNTGGRQTIAQATINASQDVTESGDSALASNLFHIGQDSFKANNGERHIFGEIKNYRGPVEDKLEASAEAEQTRRPVPGTPLIKRFNTTLQFPLLDSFPSIFYRSTDITSIPIRTRLVTDTSIATRMKTLRFQTSRLFGLDDREVISNGLDEIADAYHDGWSSGSDEDDD